MNIKQLLVGLSIASVAMSSFTSCGSKNENANQSGSVQESEQHTENPNAERIAELEAQREVIIAKIQSMGEVYEAAHPEISTENLTDSLNAHTIALRQQSRELQQQIDSLKAL